MALTDTNLKGDHLRIISAKFGWDWLSSFRGEDFFVSAVLYPRWPPLLKIEMSSNGQNCSILSQKVPKFELYKHNDELFNIYYGIFYELWTFTDLFLVMVAILDTGWRWRTQIWKGST
jgi:hypothetical protein